VHGPTQFVTSRNLRRYILPEHGESDGQPDGDGMHDDTETGEEQHVVDGRIAVALRVPVEIRKPSSLPR